MQIEVFLFDDFTAMDFIGPVEALQRLPETTVRYVSLEGGLVKNAQGLRIRSATRTISTYQIRLRKKPIRQRPAMAIFTPMAMRFSS